MNPNDDSRKSEITVAAAVIVSQEGRFLLARKKPGLANGGQWEFPGGKVEPEESPAQALERELKEELELTSEVPYIPLLQYSWVDSSRTIHFHFFIVRTFDFYPQSRDHDAFAWIMPGESFPDVVEADRKTLSYLVEHPEVLRTQNPQKSTDH